MIYLESSDTTRGGTALAHLLSTVSLDNINRDLDSEGNSDFQVISGKSAFAAVHLSQSYEGRHKLTMTVAVKNKVQTGQATIFRSGRSDVTPEELWSAFGTAYARAVDAPPAPRQPAFLTGEVEVNDYVQVRAAWGNFRGVVVDVVSSRRSGVVR